MCYGNTSQCKVCCVTGEVWVCYGNMSQCKVCCVTGEVWVCYGNQSECKVCIVDCKEGTMTDQPIQVNMSLTSRYR